MHSFLWKKYTGCFFLSAILFLLFMVVWRSLVLFSPEQPSFSLRMVIKTATPQIAKLYYDLGEGLSKKNAVEGYLTGDGNFQECLFAIPTQSIRGFRFDPSIAAGALVIKKADIVMHIAGNLTMTVKRIDLQDLRPTHQIKEFAVKAGELTVIPAENADDPQIAIPVSISFDAWYQSVTFLPVLQMILKILAIGLLCPLLMWIWFRWDDTISGIVAVVALVIFGLRCGPIYFHAAPLLNITVQSSAYGKMQLFYDLGKGFSENDSVSCLIVPAPNERTYQMEIPSKRIMNLRIDPPASKDLLVIGRISITDGLGYPLKPFHIDFKDAFSNKEISVFRIEGSSISLRTQENADDPQVFIPLASPLFVEINPFHLLFRSLFELLFIYIAAMAVVLFCISANKPERLPWFLLAVSIGILFLRYPGIILDPRFLAEEGSLFFWRAYHSDTISLTTFFYNYETVGYYNFMADFSAWVAATFLSLPNAPYATLCLSFLIQIIPLFLIATSRCSLWTSPLKKTLGCLLVLLVPLSSEVWLNTLGTQFHLGLISFLILLESGEACAIGKKWFFRALLLIGGFSGVSSCLLAPLFYLKGACRRQRETFIHAALLTFATSLQLFSLWNSSNMRLANMGDPLSLIANMVNSNLVSTLLGPSVAYHLARIIYGMMGNAGLVLPVLLICLLTGEGMFLYGMSRRTRDPLLSVMTLGTLLLTITIAYIGMIASKWETVDPFNAPRYFWLSNVILAFCVSFALKEQPSFSKTIRGNPWVVFCLLSILINGTFHYDMANDAPKMPSWKTEVSLWMQNDDKKTIALWPQGWHVSLKKKEPSNH